MTEPPSNAVRSIERRAKREPEARGETPLTDLLRLTDRRARRRKRAPPRPTRRTRCRGEAAAASARDSRDRPSSSQCRVAVGNDATSGSSNAALRELIARSREKQHRLADRGQVLRALACRACRACAAETSRRSSPRPASSRSRTACDAMRPPNEWPPSQIGSCVRSAAAANAAAIALRSRRPADRHGCGPPSMNGKSKRKRRDAAAARTPSAIACMLACRMPAPAPCASTSAATASCGHCHSIGASASEPCTRTAAASRSAATASAG